MSKKNKKMAIKHFADLKMHAVPIADHMTPFDHPASEFKHGAQMMQPTDMGAGTTAGPIKQDHTNIQD